MKKMKDENRELNLYLKQISKIPFLSREEEKTLFSFILNGNRKSVAEKAKKGDERAKKQLVEDEKAQKRIIESHFLLVWKMARKYQAHKIDIFDLIQEGNLGLFRAMEKFETKKDCRFSFYAQYWIRVQLGSFAKKERKKETISLDAPLDRKDGGISTDPLIDFIADDRIPDPEKVVFGKEPKKETIKVIPCLMTREEQIVKGLFDGERIETIAIRIGISRQWANVLKLRAVKKLKKKGGFV